MGQENGKARLSIEKQGPVARIWLDRAEVRNAMDPQALDEITATFRRLATDRSVRVAVLGGRGPDFCAGADIAWMKRAGQMGRPKAERDAQKLIGMCRAVDEAPFLTIARVQGNCFGGGLGLVSSCDVVVAGESARFCFSEVRLGIIPAVVSTFILPKIGMGQARRWFLTAEPFGAETACELGIAHVACADDRLEAEVERLASQTLRNGPVAIGLAKAYLRQMEGLPRSRRIAHSARMLAKVRASEEAQEGFTAFLEKRSPKWHAPSASSK